MVKMSLAYWSLKELAKEAPEAYEIIRAEHNKRSLEPAPPAAECAEGKGSYFTFEAYMNDIGELPDVVLKRASFEAVRALKLVAENGDSMSGKTLREAMAIHQVHLPGNELLMIDTVEVREDYCTEALQSDMAKGWRIVAVIPRAGQRRPDYVLGRRGAF